MTATKTISFYGEEADAIIATLSNKDMEIKSLRQQLASRDAEVATLREQVTLLRDAALRAKSRIQGLSGVMFAEKDACKYIDEALAATEPTK